MSNPYLLAVALSISALTAACSPHEQANGERLAAFLTGNDLAADAGEPEPTYPTVTENVTVQTPAPAAIPEPVELKYGDSGYVCVPVFRQLSCDDDGKPHHLNGDMSWRD